MAAPKITIKIGSDTSGLKKGARESQSIAQKLGRGITHAFDIAAASVAGFAAKMAVDGVKGAIEDARAQRVLAKQLHNTIGATDDQVASMEKWISKMQLAYGINDNKLRPSLARLIRSTHDMTKAQQLLKLGMDISAATGKDLDTVVAALGKAQDGNSASLGRLGLGLDSAILKSKDTNLIFGTLRKSFQGFADQEANTTEGKLRRLNEKWGEMQESLGNILLDGLQPLIDWATSPEGGKVLEEVVGGLGTAFKDVAEALPGIINKLKALGKVAGGLGIDPKSFLTPELLAAAAAFRLTPGPIQVKALAAIAAYAVAANAGAESHVGAFKGGYEQQYRAGMDRYAAQTYGGYAPTTQLSVGGIGVNNTGVKYYGAGTAGMLTGTTIINVQTLDPAAAGKAVKTALNAADKTGTTKTGGRGVG